MNFIQIKTSSGFKKNVFIAFVYNIHMNIYIYIYTCFIISVHMLLRTRHNTVADFINSCLMSDLHACEGKKYKHQVIRAVVAGNVIVCLFLFPYIDAYIPWCLNRARQTEIAWFLDNATLVPRFLSKKVPLGKYLRQLLYVSSLKSWNSLGIGIFSSLLSKKSRCYSIACAISFELCR